VKKYLVTGGFGFIGSNFVNYLFAELSAENSDFEIHCIDVMTYAAKKENVKKEIRESDNFVHHKIDITSDEISSIFEDEFEYCVHFAAESHVDNSIEGPEIFAKTNVLGTANLLEKWRKTQKRRFIHVSTDEVYGSITVGRAREDDILRPSSPYSASKAASDLIALSYSHTYGMDVVVTRCCNNFGPNQHPEKLIPKIIGNCQNSTALPIYGDGTNIREWIYVGDHTNAIIALTKAPSLKFSIYNIGTSLELSNLEIVKDVIRVTQSNSRIEYVPDRLGHDFRYALDSSRITEEIGWKPVTDFQAGLAQTIASFWEESSR
jgi:dTDP-glucose 4,6-dehydratase